MDCARNHLHGRRPQRTKWIRCKLKRRVRGFLAQGKKNWERRNQFDSFQTYEYWRHRLLKLLERRRRSQTNSKPSHQCSQTSSVCSSEVEKVISVTCLPRFSQGDLVCVGTSAINLARHEVRFRAGCFETLPPGQDEEYCVSSAIRCTEADFCQTGAQVLPSNLHMPPITSTHELVCVGGLGTTTYSDPSCQYSSEILR